MIVGSSLKMYSALRSSLVRLLNILEEILMSNNLSSRLLRYVSITLSLLFVVNADLDLNSHLKCHISRIFLSYSSNSVFNFALSILLAVGINFSHLDKREISASERFHLERNNKETTIAMFFFKIRSITSTTNYLILTPK